jgi:mRNA-degrading endonuclease toxin of MazEF toxin-antitoxin module
LSAAAPASRPFSKRTFLFCSRLRLHHSHLQKKVYAVPLTSEDRGSEYEVEMPKLPFLRLEGVANVQGIGSLSVKRLERKLGVLPAEVMQRIKQALRFALDLD